MRPENLLPLDLWLSARLRFSVLCFYPCCLPVRTSVEKDQEQRPTMELCPFFAPSPWVELSSFAWQLVFLRCFQGCLLLSLQPLFFRGSERELDQLRQRCPRRWVRQLFLACLYRLRQWQEHRVHPRLHTSPDGRQDRTSAHSISVEFALLFLPSGLSYSISC